MGQRKRSKEKIVLERKISKVRKETMRKRRREKLVTGKKREKKSRIKIITGSSV